MKRQPSFLVSGWSCLKALRRQIKRGPDRIAADLKWHRPGAPALLASGLIRADRLCLALTRMGKRWPVRYAWRTGRGVDGLPPAIGRHTRPAWATKVP